MKVDYFNTFAANSPVLSGYVSPKNDKTQRSPQKTNLSTKKKKKNVSNGIKSKNQRKGDNQKLQKQSKQKRQLKKNYEINPMYASKISQIRSEVSVSSPKIKINLTQIRKLQQKVTSQILILREEKIHLMEELNGVTDKKNKCIEMIQTYRNLKQKQFDDQTLLIQKQNSYLSKRESPNKNYSKKSNTDHYSSIKKMEEIFQASKVDVFRIKDQILSPLLQHPLLLKNKELKQELRALQKQSSGSNISAAQIQAELSFLQSQNKHIQKQIRLQNQKLKKIQKQRLATFFPKDKNKIDLINSLLAEQEHLLNKKQSLQKNMSSRTIIRTAQDELWIQQLKQQNNRLMQDVQALLQNHRKRNKYQNVSIEQLQREVQLQLNGKKHFMQNLQSFKTNIRRLQESNKSLRSKQKQYNY